MSRPSVSLLISTYNRPVALEKVLVGVQRQTMMPREVLIADDGSGEETRTLVDSWKARLGCPLQHVWHPDQGFRKTIILNKCLARSIGDYLVFLDGDCVPHPRFISDHQRLAEQGCWVQGRRCFVKEQWVNEFDLSRISPMAWALSGRMTGVAKAIRLPFPLVRRNTAQRGIIGCNQAAWRADLTAINGFDEEYTGWGIGEDSDLGTRLYHLGRPRKFAYAHAVVYHLDHPSPSKDHLPDSLARLAATIRSGKIRCEVGLDHHLAPAPKEPS
ncbi:MAG: glycosyltransferase family 2 protein [Verrucomicrobia bacterium]|jgi:glycosyltransferase involved in cell wall biosynthesis|nr:glycosyltransferase family 2 protein [Verrucomicrobiota bacterium]